jgi:hypothetical protein
MTFARLIVGFFGQWLAAGYLTLPVVLYWVLQHHPERLRHNDFLQVNACLAPLAALWVVLWYRRARLSVWWVAGRVAGLLLASAAVTWKALDPAHLGVLEVDPLRIGAVLVLLWVWTVSWRLVDRRWFEPLPPNLSGTSQRGPVQLAPRPNWPSQPVRGQIWSAKVPFEKGTYDEGAENQKDRPCLVISTFTRHAYVLKITSIDQGNRPGYLMMPAGWHPWSQKASWIKLQPLLKVPFSDFRQYIRDSPDWAWSDLADRYSARATPDEYLPRTSRRTTSPLRAPVRVPEEIFGWPFLFTREFPRGFIM